MGTRNCRRWISRTHKSQIRFSNSQFANASSQQSVHKSTGQAHNSQIQVANTTLANEANTTNKHLQMKSATTKVTWADTFLTSSISKCSICWANWQTRHPNMELINTEPANTSTKHNIRKYSSPQLNHQIQLSTGHFANHISEDYQQPQSCLNIIGSYV